MLPFIGRMEEKKKSRRGEGERKNGRIETCPGKEKKGQKGLKRGGVPEVTLEEVKVLTRETKRSKKERSMRKSVRKERGRTEIGKLRDK